MNLKRNLRSIVAVAGGIAAAVGVILATVLPHHYKLAVVPQKYATLTHQQSIIVALGRKNGVGSGIVYVWGGTTPRGFDCSGFVWYVVNTSVRFTGKRLIHPIPRTSYSMFNDSGKVVKRRDLRPADILFFRSGGSNSNPGHVGLYLGGGRMVEYYSSGRPARSSLLRSHADYVGARRWWWPLRIRKRTLYPALYVAKRWHLKIAGNKGDTVVFVPRRFHGHLRFARWKRRAILRWAHHNHHPVRGYYNHINIKLHK